MSGTNWIGVATVALALSLGIRSAAAEVAVVVSPRNTVTTLSKQQVADIFLGRMSRLPNGERAVPVDQAEGSAARDEFYATFTNKSAAQLKAHWSKIIFTGRGYPPKAVPTSSDVKKAISKHPDTIGYIERDMLDDTVKLLPLR